MQVYECVGCVRVCVCKDLIYLLSIKKAEKAYNKLSSGYIKVWDQKVGCKSFFSVHMFYGLNMWQWICIIFVINFKS